jgi:hypothetical protein
MLQHRAQRAWLMYNNAYGSYVYIITSNISQPSSPLSHMHHHPVARNIAQKALTVKFISYRKSVKSHSQMKD